MGEESTWMDLIVCADILCENTANSLIGSVHHHHKLLAGVRVL